MYNPYYGMQPGYNPMMAQAAQQQRQQNIIKGRVVGNIDEVRAAQIDLDGSCTYFPCPAEKAIFVKSISLNGMPVVQVYKLEEAQADVKYITSADLKEIQERLASLEGRVEGGGQNEYNASATNG